MSIILMMILWSVSVLGAEVTVATVDELFTAVDINEDTPIHLNAAVFNLATKTGGGSDLTLDYDCTIDIVYGDDVVIDGYCGYNVKIQDATITMGNVTGNHRLIITRGDVHSCLVSAPLAATTANFYYCDFNESEALNGLSINSNPSYDVTVNAYHCRAFNDANDGFSIYGTDSHAVAEVMNLNDCDSYSNGKGASDQGATCHVTGHFLNINGGNYYSNAGQGIAIAGGNVTVKGANVYSNGGSGITINTGTFYIEGCTIKPSASQKCIGVDDGLGDIRNCMIWNVDKTGSYSIYIGGGVCTIEYNLIRGTAPNSYGIYTMGRTIIRNNVFYDVERAIRTLGLYIIQDNVFHTVADFAIYDYAFGGYYANSGCMRGNHFYNCAAVVYPTDALNANDFNEIDPKFMDIINNNTKLQTSSPLIDTGIGTFLDGKTTVGNWQPSAIINSSGQADCPPGDLDRDCKVNLFDFALMAENWLQANSLPFGSVIVSEVMAHSHAEAPDWIELYNTAGSTIDIGGWYLSDSDSPLTKYKIPNGTTIPPYGYIVFYEDVTFGVGINAFRLSENGETVYLSFPDVNILPKHICDDRKFGASETSVSLGLYATSTDDVEFVAMDSNTPGQPNAYPKVGPIVISEIMYNPGPYGSDAEYIELHNIENYPVPLQVYDPCIGGNVPWKLTEGPDFDFDSPPDINIPANGYLIVAKNPGLFTSKYGSMPAGVQVLGPFLNGTKLSNGGENVEISMPGDLDPDDPNIRSYIRIDYVRYSDGSQHEDFPGLDPWPKDADGTDDGYSLIRKDMNLYGNDVSNWKADSPTPGY